MFFESKGLKVTQTNGKCDVIVPLVHYNGHYLA